METWDPGQRWRYGALQAAGLGAVAGGVEALAVAAAPVPWSAPDLLALGAVAVGVDALAGGVLGLAFGAVHTLRRAEAGYRNVAVQLGLVGAALAAAGLLPWAAELHATGRPAPAAAAVALAGITGVVVTLNARYWLARLEIGHQPPARWRTVAAGIAAALVLLAALVGSALDRQSGHGLPGDPSALVITVDGLTRDAAAELAAVRALAATGTTFEVAIAPTGAAVAANATVWTGLHPLRHRALDDGRALAVGLPTVADRLGEEGYATAAFVSSARVVGVGLDAGFVVFDDHLGGPGLHRLRVPRWLGAVAPLRRGPSETAARAVAWWGANAARGAVVWVHLEATAASAELDTAIGSLLAAVEASGRAERTLVALVGTPGRGQGLSEAVVRVPLVLRAPGQPPRASVAAQVRLADVGATVLAWSALALPPELEGQDRLAFHRGVREGSVWTTLVGGNADDGWLVGLRQDEVKAVWDVDGDAVALYHLGVDPEERADQALAQPDAVASARKALEPELAALRRVAADPELGDARAAVLRALEARR